jgi:ribosomal protein S18 acetylase RimI-like enzyme
MQQITLGGKGFLVYELSEERPDVEMCLLFINSFIEDPEGMMLNKNKMSMQDEKAWLEDMLAQARMHKAVVLIAEHKGVLAGMTHAGVRPGRADHVAELGLAVAKEYRGLGLGSYLLKAIAETAREKLQPEPRMLRLSVFAGNDKAMALYKKHGFEVVARIPKQFQFGDGLVDEIVMLRVF